MGTNRNGSPIIWKDRIQANQPKSAPCSSDVAYHIDIDTMQSPAAITYFG